MPQCCTSHTACRWRYFVPSLLVLAGITYLSLIKDVPVPELQPLLLADKWGHMVAYLVFALCLAGDSYRARISTRVTYMVAVLIPVLYGGLIELIQPYIPPRSGEWLDWAADCIGAGIGIALFALFRLVVNRKHTSAS